MHSQVLEKGLSQKEIKMYYVTRSRFCVNQVQVGTSGKKPSVGGGGRHSDQSLAVDWMDSTCHTTTQQGLILEQNSTFEISFQRLCVWQPEALI